MTLAYLSAAVIAGGLLLGACSAHGTRSAESLEALLLTAEEAGGGENAEVDRIDIGASTTCGPDRAGYMPNEAPGVVRYDQGERAVILALWEEEGNAQDTIDSINNDVTGEVCREGVPTDPDAAKQQGFNWRVDPINLGNGVAAFRAVEWSLVVGQPPPPEPVLSPDVQIFSTARAYGIVEGKLLMVRIDQRLLEPPSEEELQLLWNHQVEKIELASE